MKYLPHAISLLTLILVCSYIQYNESKRGIESNVVSQAFYPKNIDLPPTEFQEYRNAISLQLPDTLTFAGEPVPLNIPDVRERLDRELHINTYWHSSTIFLMKRANKWFPEMEKILKENGIPEDFKYLAAIEGGFMNAVSPANAVGFWQIRKDAGKENGLEIGRDVDERYDPIKSTEAACRYLNKAYKKFGNWTNVAASYNRGMSGLGRALSNQQEGSYYDLMLNDETSRYVFRILAIKEIFQNPKKYGFNINASHLYKSEELRYVTIDSDIKDLVQFAKDQGINYKLLKRHNPWLRDDNLNVRRGKSYQIAIPII
ncbi:lytic transglycosylase domain-containing protein [Fulvivirga lutimaris]|uniref:lytic transglycosylase domain-containing protein n=1 Tax=Fulvivirga lutimaris TaxID=1819566 RepID=UPI0012BD3B4E|nr:lytic transglycosylase domain-containing protein [Fulvivirga lutimaris]MTI38442.1 lytic transglycosylase domain-containing protein [Fulvivirga lutimaris]